MPNMGHTITHQVMKNHIRLYQTQTTGKENQWQPRKESQVLGMRASSIWAEWPSYCEHNQVDTHKRTHAHTHAHTHTHTYIHTHITSVFPVLEQSLSSVRCQGHERLALLPALQLLRWLHLLHSTRQKKQLVLNHIILYLSQYTAQHRHTTSQCYKNLITHSVRTDKNQSTCPARYNRMHTV